MESRRGSRTFTVVWYRPIHLHSTQSTRKVASLIQGTDPRSMCGCGSYMSSQQPPEFGSITGLSNLAMRISIIYSGHYIRLLYTQLSILHSTIGNFVGNRCTSTTYGTKYCTRITILLVIVGHSSFAKMPY